MFTPGKTTSMKLATSLSIAGAAVLMTLSFAVSCGDSLVSEIDVGSASDTGSVTDGEAQSDGETPIDGGNPVDTGTETDTGTTTDIGTETDAGTTTDTGTETDAGTTTDTGTVTDTGTATDAGTETDTGIVTDTGTATDTGITTDAGNPTIPTVLSTIPADGSTGAFLNADITATFSEAMDPLTVTITTFTLKQGNTSVSGTVAYAGTTATFNPASNLTAGTAYTATITTGAMSVSGVALAASHVWIFTTGHTTIALPVNLGTAGGFAILAKSGISTVPASIITGNIGVSPAAATFITGFSLIADASNVFSTSTQVTGKVYASNYAPPTPSNMTTAVSDMQLAFTDAAGRAADVTGLGAGNIGGMNLAAGVYKWGTGLLIPTDITLTGSATDVWIFQIAQNLTMSSAVQVHLAGGALPKNIFWQVAGSVDLGTTAHCEGTILTQTAVALRTGASINGRLLAQTAVSINTSTVAAPAP